MELIENDGKIYSKDQIDQAVKFVKEVWEKVKRYISKMLEFLKSKLRRIYYQFVPTGKSNNWRKAHGLKPIRRSRKHGKY